MKFSASAVKNRRVTQAFILGAGLGNRLRPLTGRLPKPLVPLFHEPLAMWAIRACQRAGINRFAINTHHLPAAWDGFGAGEDVTLFHEPILLETGGGLKNIAPWIGSEPILIHNGDIFSTMSLEKLIAVHKASGCSATLALRSEGIAKHIAIDTSKSIITDIHHKLGRAHGTHVFSGIYCINREFLDLIPANQKISVIPALLELAKSGQLGAVVLDEGIWLDLGDRNSYLQAHRELDLAPKIHPQATVESGATIERSVIGPRAFIAAGAVVRDSVIWPGATVSAVAVLDRCIVFSEDSIAGAHQDSDL